MYHVAGQVLVIGKISQAAVVAASAYRNEDTFRRQTGILKSRLIDDRLHRNTKVCLLHFAPSPRSLGSIQQLDVEQSTSHNLCAAFTAGLQPLRVR